MEINMNQPWRELSPSEMLKLKLEAGSVDANGTKEEKQTVYDFISCEDA